MRGAEDEDVEALDERRLEQRDKYFDLLEKKETHRRKEWPSHDEQPEVCGVHRCKKCKKTTMYKPSGICKDERHPITRHDAVQKFFQCKACSRRMTTIDKYPQASCKSCGGSSYERVGMWKEKTVQLEAEKLCLRGAESKFLDSQLKS
ncbi:PREDICTED: protein MCM10 homolog [Priapulus caudatus]|uniref:Protein MCM10 homolog n=1 Tax=Priapulus caudatus TaxID=37621 RepID=A0ABM1F249_PRICU|nr:PREDICTED: protein MCM10 homolog [Priapulus caudatus]